MNRRTVLVTGSCGLIGSEVCKYFADQRYQINGIDSNHRAVFFGPDGDTTWTLNALRQEIPEYRHFTTDITNRAAVMDVVKQVRPAVIVHTAAQPSHDRAASIPFLDFEVNALGTLQMLEAARQICPESPFVHMSTNKVYGDRPNQIPIRETAHRWEFADPAYQNGINEHFPTDQSTHSLFGVSKLAGDAYVQEYGRYFGMPTCCLRGGCLTGPNHTAVQLHGFLSYLIKCNIESREYRVHGYKGKQVRDNIHSQDVAAFIYEVSQAPRCGEVYNIGGGKTNSCSILEAFDLVAGLTGRPMRWIYSDQARIGDHICYYTDLSKAREHYPSWSITKTLTQTFEDIVEGWFMRLGTRGEQSYAAATVEADGQDIRPGVRARTAVN